MKKIFFLFILLLLNAFYKIAYSQICNTAIAINLPYTASGQTTCGQNNDYDSLNTVSCGNADFMSGEDVLYGFTPSTSGYILMNFSSSQVQTGIFLFQGCPDNGICVASNTSYSTTNAIGFNASAGIYYTILIDRWSSTTCIPSYDFSVSLPGKEMPNEQDCSGAIPVCSDTYIQSNSYSGTGNVPNEINSSASCLSSGEINSVWYVLQEQTTGDLSFTINPNSPTDDYDWAVFNITNTGCDQIYSNASLEISCNASGNAGSTGANGQSGSQYNAIIPVVKGDIYVIEVSNYWPTQSGYTLDFSSSTSQLYDTIGPQFLSIDSLPICNSSTLKIKFTDNVMCNSVSVSDFKLIGPGGSYTITGFSSEGCDIGADYDKYYSFTISPSLTSSGDFYFILQDTIVDFCGNVGIYPDTLPFTVDSIIIASGVTASDCKASTGSIITSVSGGISPYTYLWQPNGETTNSINNLSAGSYSITVTDMYGCKAEESILVQDKNAPILNISSYKEPLCHGDANGFIGVTVVSGTPSYTYLWSDPLSQQTDTAQNLTAGYYYVEVTDGVGCIAVADTILNEPDSIRIDLTDTIDICANSSVSLLANVSGGNAPYLYTWNTSLIGDTNTAIVYPSITTTFSLIVSDINGCSSASTSSTVMVNDAPLAGFGYDPDPVTLQNPDCGFSDSSQLASAWEWFLNGNLFASIQNPNYTFTAAGNYTVEQIVYHTDGCSDTAYKTIVVTDSRLSIQFPTVFTPNGDGLNDRFLPLVDGAVDKDYSFIICDRWGAQVFNTNNLTEGWNGRVNGNKIVEGAYSYKVRIKDVLNKEYTYIGMITVLR